MASGRIFRDVFRHILANVQNQRLEGASTITLGSTDISSSPPLDAPNPNVQVNIASTHYARATARRAHTYVQSQMQTELRSYGASTIGLGDTTIASPLDVAQASGGTLWRQENIAATNARAHRQQYQQIHNVDPNPPVEIADTEAGTGTDAGEIVDLSESDTGAGTDAGEVVDVFVPPTRGPDVYSVFQRTVRSTHTYVQAQMQVRAINNGASVTTILTEFYVNDTETGAGTDASELVDLTEADTGTGTDAGEVLDVFVTPTRGPDVYSIFQRTVRKTHTYVQAQMQVRAINNGAYVTTTLTQFADTDIGTGTDAGELVDLPEADTGAGTDAGELVAITEADTGAGTDAGELVDLTEADTGTGTDGGEVLDTGLIFPARAPDVASFFQRNARKTHTYVQAQIQIRAINNAASTISLGSPDLIDPLLFAQAPGGTLWRAETIASTNLRQHRQQYQQLQKWVDTASQTVDLTEADTGTGTDAGELVDLTQTDTGVGTDAGEFIAATLSEADTGAGTDASELVGIIEAESGTGTDLESLDAQETVGEFGSGLDNGESIQATVPEADTGTATDAGEVVAITQVETGVGTDAEIVGLAEVDSGIGTDAGERPGPVEIESGAVTDAGEFLTASVIDGEVGSGLDAAGTIALSGVGDVGSGTDAGEAIETPGPPPLHMRWATDFASVGEFLTPMLVHGLTFVHPPEGFPLGFAPLTLTVSIQSTARVVPPATLPITVTANQPIGSAKCYFVDAFQNQTQVGFSASGSNKLTVKLLTTGLPGGQSTFRVEVADLTGNVTVASLPILIDLPEPYDAFLVIGPKTLAHREASHGLETTPGPTPVTAKPYDAVLVVSKHGLASQESSHPLEMV